MNESRNERRIDLKGAFEVYNIDRWTDKYRQSSLANIFKALCFYKYNKKYSKRQRS